MLKGEPKRCVSTRTPDMDITHEGRTNKNWRSVSQRVLSPFAESPRVFCTTSFRDSSGRLDLESVAKVNKIFLFPSLDKTLLMIFMYYNRSGCQIDLEENAPEKCLIAQPGLHPAHEPHGHRLTL